MQEMRIRERGKTLPGKSGLDNKVIRISLITSLLGRTLTLTLPSSVEPNLNDDRYTHAKLAEGNEVHVGPKESLNSPTRTASDSTPHNHHYASTAATSQLRADFRLEVNTIHHLAPQCTSVPSSDP